jgi:hypothetical protein
MASFGKQDGGGRRTAPRSAALLPARLTTTTRSIPVHMLDVSATGARVRGAGLPEAGAELILGVERAQTFARICWSEGEERGLLFEEPLTNAQIERLKAEAHLARLMQLTPDQKLAVDDWVQGIVR